MSCSPGPTKGGNHCQLLWPLLFIAVVADASSLTGGEQGKQPQDLILLLCPVQTLLPVVCAQAQLPLE